MKQLTILRLRHRLHALLTPDERRTERRVMAAVSVGALLDLAGLAALLPGLLFLLDGGEGRQRAALCCLAAVAFIVMKNALRAALVRYESAYLLGLYRRLSLSLFRSYYRRGLLFIRERGSMRLGYEVNNLCHAVAFQVMGPLLMMTGEVLLAGIVTVALLAYSPRMALLLYASFVPLVAVYVGLVKRRVRTYGQRDMEERRRQARLVVETMRGYPELELNGAFAGQYQRMEEGFDRLQKDRLQLQVVQGMPLFLSELSVALGLSLLVLFTRGDVTTPAGIFAVAAFRLLPSIRSLLNGWTQIQNALFSLDVVEEGLGQAAGDGSAVNPSGAAADTPSCDATSLPFEREIRLEHISFEYIGGQPVLTDFTASIRRGEYVGVCGPSGVGKTTLFNLLMGFFAPTAGTIRIDGEPLTPQNRAAWQRRLGYVSQEIFVLHDTVLRNIAPGTESPDRKRVEEALRQACLGDWLAALPAGLDTQMGEDGTTLSGGQRQRLGIARALYKQADVLLLDEATSALDSETERAVNQTLQQLKTACPGLTVVMIAHRESSLAYCERRIQID